MCFNPAQHISRIHRRIVPATSARELIDIVIDRPKPIVATLSEQCVFAGASIQIVRG